MIVRVYYDHDALFIDGIRQALIAGTLRVSSDGLTISITTANQSQPLAAGPYSIFGRQDGSGFATASDCLAYLQDEFAKHRLFSFEFEQNAAAAQWPIAHWLGFRPNVTVIDSSGDVVLADIAYADANALTVVFGRPTAGVAYLS